MKSCHLNFLKQTVLSEFIFPSGFIMFNQKSKIFMFLKISFHGRNDRTLVLILYFTQFAFQFNIAKTLLIMKINFSIFTVISYVTMALELK